MTHSLRGRRWPTELPLPPAGTYQFFDRLGIPRLVGHLLYNRGIHDEIAIGRFLAGPDAPLADPHLLKGLPTAVARILRAIDAGERIVVLGDYDVDGLTSVAVLVEAFRLLGVEPEVHIPHRERDGYGLNGAILARQAAAGATLAIAVDCGITARDEVATARSLGLDVVVVDHHHVPSELPEAVAIVNPRQPGCAFPAKDLAAVGLAFNLARAFLVERLGVEGERRSAELLGLVALGTIADVVPLIGENRTLVARGLRQLNRSPGVGIARLCAVAGVKVGRITTRVVSHYLAPRLNAAGRLDDARDAYELLVTRDAPVAERLANGLEARNRERQQHTAAAFDAAAEVVAAAPDDLVFVASEDFHPGVIGLVAGRIVDRVYRPAVVVALGAEEARGSARSIEEFHLVQALDQVADLLTKYGGHALAAGFSVPRQHVDELRDRLTRIARESLDATVRANGPLLPRQWIDGAVSPRRLSKGTAKMLEQLEPHGEGNPEPVFLGRSLRILSSSRAGRDGAHLRLMISDRETHWPAIGFGLGAHVGRLPDVVDVAYQVVQNDWNGYCTLELRIEDVCPSGRC